VEQDIAYMVANCRLEPNPTRLARAHRAINAAAMKE
jgi:hypothetical protein